MAGGYISIGERIAVVRRRRGMSQAVLAGRLGRSAQWLSNIERGVRSPDRYSVLVPIADALRVSVAELTGERAATASSRRVPDAEVQALRLALSGHPSVPEATETDGKELAERVHAAWRLVHCARYSELGELLPCLLRDCAAAAWRGAPDGFRLVAELHQAAAAMMAKLGQADAAWVAADRSVFAAMQAGDVLLAGAGSFRLGHAFLTSGRLDQADQAATMGADALEPLRRSGDADALALSGALHLVRAVAAARHGDAEGAWEAIGRAEAAAATLGPAHRDERFDTEFGTQNVAVHAVAVAVELGDAAEALRRFDGLETHGLSPERTARLFLDVARAHAQRRETAHVVRYIEAAERLAPEMVRRHWLARETVRDLLRRGRGSARREPLALAVRLGIP